jgi:hypothetical protein
MKLSHFSWIAAAFIATASFAASAAQVSAPKSSEPQTQGRQDAARDLEPAVNTSAATPSVAPSAAPALPVPSAAPAPASNTAAKRSAQPAGQQPAPSSSPQPGGKSGRVIDRLNLDATQVTGNSELPKVLYIVPWKRADLGDLNGRPLNSLLDEVLTPIDRDVFRRENRYYDALEAAEGGPQVQGGRDEK